MKRILLIITPMLLIGCVTSKEIVSNKDLIEQIKYTKNQPLNDEYKNKEDLESSTFFEDILLGQENIKTSLDNKAYIKPINTQKSKFADNDIIVKADNTVVYPYGITQPKLICGKLRVCSIELQAGENILNIVSGDNERWHIKVAYSGSQGKYIPTIMVKPLFANNIETNIMVTTDKRMYDIHLKSIDEGEFTPRISFIYPENDIEIIQNPQNNQEKQTNYSKSTNISIDSMNLNYGLKGDKKTAWYPTLVFDDGKKVFIKFNEAIETGELPIFLGLTSSNKKEIINYRYKKPYMVVDKLFSKGVLVLNDGKKQNLIEIIKN